MVFLANRRVESLVTPSRHLEEAKFQIPIGAQWILTMSPVSTNDAGVELTTVRLKVTCSNY